MAYRNLIVGFLVAGLVLTFSAAVGIGIYAFYGHNQIKDLKKVNRKLRDKLKETRASLEEKEKIIEKRESRMDNDHSGREEYTPNEIDYFLEIAFGAEFGEPNPRIKKWTSDLEIKVIGSPTKKDRITLNKVIKEINSLIGGINLRVDEQNPNLEIYFVPESDFDGYEPNYVPTNYGFFYDWWNSSMEIYRARIMISTNQVTQKERSHLIREELTQSLGLMNDSWKYKDSIFYQGWTDATEYGEIDKAMIKILYRKEIHPNMTKNQVQTILSNLE